MVDWIEHMSSRCTELGGSLVDMDTHVCRCMSEN